ncbi:19681_t:CDS:1, partial [Cetraspora pellucida]
MDSQESSASFQENTYIYESTSDDDSNNISSSASTSTSTKKKRGRNKSSFVWKHFKVIGAKD